MEKIDQFSLVLTEVGPVFDEIQAITGISDDTWSVDFEEDAIEVQCDEVGNMLSFSMNIGPVEESLRGEIFPLLLSYNFLKDETGGFHMAIDGPEGSVFLLLDLFHVDIDVARLAAVLATMLELGQNWRDVIAGNSSEVAAPETNELPPGSLRV